MSDNGAGITPATVAGLCDFTMLVSDKARYRGPTRGAQGNALKTLLGIPYALGVAEPVVIESAGVRHELRVTVDRVGDVVVTHDDDRQRPHGGHLGDRAAARRPRCRRPAVGVRRGACKSARHHQRD